MGVATRMNDVRASNGAQASMQHPYTKNDRQWPRLNKNQMHVLTCVAMKLLVAKPIMTRGGFASPHRAWFLGEKNVQSTVTGLYHRGLVRNRKGCVEITGAGRSVLGDPV